MSADISLPCKHSVSTYMLAKQIKASVMHKSSVLYAYDTYLCILGRYSTYRLTLICVC